MPFTLVGELNNNVNEIVAGADFSCARKGGTVYRWGAALGATGDVLTPAAVSGLTDAAQISVGAAGSTCARARATTPPTAVCWGAGTDGQLGNDASADSATPVAVSNLSSVRRATAGARHCCAVRSGGGTSVDGDILCWGEGSAGELGNAARDDSDVPVTVAH